MTEIDSEYWKKEYQRDLDLKAKQICEDGAKIERLEDENKRLRGALEKIAKGLPHEDCVPCEACNCSEDFAKQVLSPPDSGKQEEK